MRIECGFFLSAVKFLRGWLKKVCKKFRKSIAVLNLLVIFANEIKTRTKMIQAIITTGTKEKADRFELGNTRKAGYEITERRGNCEFAVNVLNYNIFRSSIAWSFVDHISLA